MFETLRKLLESVSSCKYADIRHEVKDVSQFTCDNGEIESVNHIKEDGFHIRCLHKGGIAQASVVDMSQIPEQFKALKHHAEQEARLFNEKVEFADAPVVKDKVLAKPEVDLRKVTFDEKKNLLLNYVNLLKKSSKKIEHVVGTYFESISKSTLVTTEGTELEEEILFCRISGRIISKEGNRVESAKFSIGACDEFKRLLNREDTLLAQAKIAVDLLKAEPVKKGVYDVICDPELTGIFTHEAFGHLSEADAITANEPLIEIMQIGKIIGSPILNIVDDGTIPYAPGTYKYDHEGVPSSKTYLIKNGKLVGRIHSRASAFKFGTVSTGNFRATSFNVNPLVRMSNIMIEAGNSKKEELIESIKDGLYLIGGKGGQTMGDLFTFGAQYGYTIRNGKIDKMICDINLSGNVYKTLMNIVGIADDFSIVEGGGCGKCRLGFYHMQMLEKSGVGGPHVKIKDIVIGGQ